jgi:hypothetical protein
MPGYNHALDTYTADLAPPGGSHFNVPFADPRTAAHVAAKVDADYAAGRTSAWPLPTAPMRIAIPPTRRSPGVTTTICCRHR